MTRKTSFIALKTSPIRFTFTKRKWWLEHKKMQSFDYTSQTNSMHFDEVNLNTAHTFFILSRSLRTYLYALVSRGVWLLMSLVTYAYPHRGLKKNCCWDHVSLLAILKCWCLFQCKFQFKMQWNVLRAHSFQIKYIWFFVIWVHEREREKN